MSRSGRFVAIRQHDGIDLVDALGTAPRRSLATEALDFACVGSALWVVADGKLGRHALGGAEDGLPLLGPPVDLAVEHGRLQAVSTGSIHAALWLGYERLLIQDLDGDIVVEDITGEASSSAFVGLLGGRRVLIADGRTLRVRDIGRGDVAEAHLPVDGQVVACVSLFGGRAMAVLMETGDGDTFLVMRPGGALIHQGTLPRTRLWAAADNRGTALVHDPASDRLIALDLRYGKVMARVEAPVEVEDLVLDADGKYVGLAGLRRPIDEDGGEGGEGAPGDPGDHDGQPGNGHAPARGQHADHDEDDRDPGPRDELAVLHVLYTDLFGAAIPASRSPERPGAKADKRAGNGELAPRPRAEPLRAVAAPEPGPSVDAAAGVAPLPPDADEASEPEPIIIPQGPLLGLGLPAGRAAGPDQRAAAGSPYASPAEHLEELLDLLTARVRLVIAHAWHTGRLSSESEDVLPYEREVYALVGAGQGYAPDALQEADSSLRELSQRVGAHAHAAMEAGMSLPFADLCNEFALGNVEAQVLLFAVAPFLRGEIARLYGILANDENRPICDRYLVEILLSESPADRGAVAHMLGAGSTLIKHGLVHIDVAGADDRLFAPITVDPVLIRRLRGDAHAGVGPADVTTIRHADRSLEELVIPDPLKRELALALMAPPRDGRPYRVLLRGRRGAGRRSLAAALAARVSRPVAVIDCERLPRAGIAFAQELGVELLRAGLRGAIPCVSGLEVFDSTDTEGLEHIRAVFRTHPTPIFLRTSPEHQPALDPGYLSFTLPPLTESERYAFWCSALERRALDADGLDRLASRFRIGPGTIEAVISAAEGQQDLHGDDDIGEALSTAARQHIETRMSNVATHIRRLAEWHQVALPDDVIDSIREFIGRVRHRRTVYDSWGFDSKMSTSRGLTALFYGAPGTGKSMVAGLIARELGLDLYRVDLARITSKWIGETEKNLAEVFDAAEDGQCIILFDEADSLFAKRTEVKSSVDRYANLEVNYLLQRLDTFEGVAILTTNLEGSIDKAFKRRMSLRLAFPFPDEEMRVRLWAAHIPPEAPTEGDFDFADLARRFPLSGGYIRNSALRAAFLAAQEDVPMTHKHLERAIHLEYREMGKLAPGGRME